MKKIAEIVEEIISANQDHVKITEILQDNLMVTSPYWNLRVVASKCNEYPSANIYICDKDGNPTECVNFTEIKIEDKTLQSACYSSDDGYMMPDYVHVNDIIKK